MLPHRICTGRREERRGRERWMEGGRAVREREREERKNTRKARGKGGRERQRERERERGRERRADTDTHFTADRRLFLRAT
jgi:hypothetical protein